MIPVARQSAGPGQGASGFTLVEVLFASLIMLIGVFGVMSAFPQAHEMSTQSGRLSVLNHLAAQKMDELQSLDYAHADLGPGIHPTFQTDSQFKRYYPVAGFPEDYSLRWIVQGGPTDGTGTAEPDMKTVIVEATFLVRYSILDAPITTTRSLEAVERSFIRE